MKNEKQFTSIPAAVIFMPSTYRNYIDIAKKMMLLNIRSVEDYCALHEPDLDTALELCSRLKRFRALCVDLMNTDCQHGYYRVSQVDIRRLLSWLDTAKVLRKKLSEKIMGSFDCEVNS